MNIKNVAVIGGGLMGRQIALNTAIYDFQVKIFDVIPACREAVKEWSETYLAGRIAKGRMTEEQVAGIKSRFTVVDTIEEACKDADMVIEAVVERVDIKHAVFKQLSDLCREDTILASNSSRMVSSTFIEDVKNPARLVNVHYFNPALVMKLIEVCCGEHTAEEVTQACLDFAAATGKVGVRINKEIDGFLVNRILGAIHNEARWLVDNGYCTYQDLDLAVENGLGHPKGPFRLADLTGIDLAMDIMNAQYKRTGVKPNGYDLYKKMYDEGRYGVKTGKGFYDYTK